MNITDLPPTRLCFSRPLSRVCSAKDLTRTPPQDLALILQKIWNSSPPTKGKQTVFHRLIQKKNSERLTIREIVGDQPNWSSILEQRMRCWIDARDYEMVFKAAHLLVGFSRKNLFDFLREENAFGENALFHFGSVCDYLQLIETLVRDDPSELLSLLLKKNATGVTALEKLLCLGHPALRILGSSIPNLLIDCLRGPDKILTEEGKSVVSKVFCFYASAQPSARVQLEMENIFQGLKALSPSLGDLYLIQKGFVQNTLKEIEPITQRISQGHVCWLDVLPDLKNICIEKLSLQLQPAVLAKSENIKEWTFFFPHPKIEQYIKSQKRELDISLLLRDKNFLERLKVLPVIDFWILGTSRNPIVHEIMGYIVDQLSCIQMKTYLKALDSTGLGFFLASLNPLHFSRVFPHFTLRLWEYYKGVCAQFFYPKKYDLKDEALDSLAQKIRESSADVPLLIAGWIAPGVQEFSAWITSLKQLPENLSKRFDKLIDTLEKRMRRYQTLLENVKREGEYPFPYLCALDHSPIMQPVKFQPHCCEGGEVYDKKNLMALRPLVSPKTNRNFSYFDFDTDGNTTYSLREIEKMLYPRQPKSASRRLLKAVYSARDPSA